MAVNWSFKQKKGQLVLVQKHNDKVNKFKINIYQANCLGALIYEFKGESETKVDKNGKPKIVNKYQFFSWWNDTKHLKNILGLTKTYNDNLYKSEWEWVEKIKLNTFFEDTLAIAKLFAKANIKVELYYKEIK